MLTFKTNPRGTLHAAYSGRVRIGYVEEGAHPTRWIWSLNTIKVGGGRDAGIEPTEEKAKNALSMAWIKWVRDAGLLFAEVQA